MAKQRVPYIVTQHITLTYNLQGGGLSTLHAILQWDESAPGVTSPDLSMHVITDRPLGLEGSPIETIGTGEYKSSIVKAVRRGRREHTGDIKTPDEFSHMMVMMIVGVCNNDRIAPDQLTQGRVADFMFNVRPPFCAKHQEEASTLRKIQRYCETWKDRGCGWLDLIALAKAKYSN